MGVSALGVQGQSIAKGVAETTEVCLLTSWGLEARGPGVGWAGFSCGLSLQRVDAIVSPCPRVVIPLCSLCPHVLLL